MKIVKGVAGVAGKGLLVGVKVIKNVGFKPLGARRFITHREEPAGENGWMRSKARNRRSSNSRRRRRRESEETNQTNSKNAATPVKHLFATPSRPPRNAPNEFDNRDAAISGDESPSTGMKLEILLILKRDKNMQRSKREMQMLRRRVNSNVCYVHRF